MSTPGRKSVPDGAAATRRDAEPRRGPTVLLVDDDEPLRPMIRLALESHGFNVLDAANADEALEACSSHDGPIGLLLVDMVLRGTTGFDLSKRLEQIRPEMRILYMSGYPSRYFPYVETLGPSRGFVQKPFTPAFLSEKVNELLRTPVRTPVRPEARA